MGAQIGKEDQEKIEEYLDKVGEKSDLISEVTHRSRLKDSSLNSETFSRILKESKIESVI